MAIEALSDDDLMALWGRIGQHPERHGHDLVRAEMIKRVGGLDDDAT